jgi:hypothetical protein
MAQHIMEPHREVCIACGYTRLEIEDRRVPIERHGTVAYREYLKGSAWTREPIIRSR